MSKINIEDETINIGDVWKSNEMLKEDIKGKIEIGNFDITDEAVALKKLTSTMHQYTKIELKLPNDFIAASREKAEGNDISFEEYLRNRLSGGISEGEQEEKKEEAEEAEEEEEEEEAQEDEEKGVRPDWDNEEEETAVPQQIVKVRCHNCKRPITITSSERPITVTCPNCSAKGRLEQ